MAKLTRLALFWRAFFLSMIFGSSSVSADPEDDAAWAAARATNTPEAFYLYLSRFPAGAYVDEAVGALSALGALRGLGSRSQGAGQGAGQGSGRSPEGPVHPWASAPDDPATRRPALVRR
jgi:hypothetical protein